MYTSGFLRVLINFIFGLIELILGFRILFEIAGANPSTPFVAWLYEVSRPLINPFYGIFPSPVLKSGTVLDMSAIIALLIYAIIAYLLSELIKFISYSSTRYYTTTTRVTRR